MITTVCLVRHGETDWNAQRRAQGREDIPLNDRGRDQAKRCAEALSDRHWDAIYSSPLSRAMDTATTIADRVGLAEVGPAPDLMERDLGAKSGLTGAETAERFGAGDVPGVEGDAALRRRAMAALRLIAERHRGGHVLAVSHGGLINQVLANVSGGVSSRGFVELANGCFSTIAYHQGGWALLSVGVADHLDDPLPGIDVRGVTTK